ncbi:hypothetical protein, partial [Salmonella sp. s54836]|uniref:hypothetical protein n=1 Tax=Salmonella sp. s54836 TaxID=3159673 RepID=UPI0039802336
INPDYVKCLHCSRSFSQNAAPGHMSFCKEQARRPKVTSSKIDDEQDKLKKRKQFKPPRPKAKTANTPPKFPPPQSQTLIDHSQNQHTDGDLK